MKCIAIITALQLGVFATVPGAHAQARINSPPTEELKQCVTAHAPGVEQTFPSLSEGVDFLLLKVCAGSMAAHSAEQIKAAAEAQKAKMAAACDAMRKKAPPDNFTDGIRTDPMFAQMCDSPMATMFDEPMNYGYLAMGGAENWPAATSLAAQTLLDLRVKRMGRKP